MRVSPVSNFNVMPLSFKASACGSVGMPRANKGIDNDVCKVVSSKEWLNSIEGANKAKAAADMKKELLKIEREEISSVTRKSHRADIEAMKDSIVNSCITFDDYKTDNFSYDNAFEHFNGWRNYVEEQAGHLSCNMNVPFEIIGEERVSIASFKEQNPNSPEAEILDSTIYKMYKLLKMNKQARTHFYDY